MSGRRAKRPKRDTETPDYAGMVRRLVRRYGQRVAVESPEDLAEMVGLVDVVNDAIVWAVAGQRHAGFSWAEIAAPLGITREAAYLRWAKAVKQVMQSDTWAASVAAHDDAS